MNRRAVCVFCVLLLASAARSKAVEPVSKSLVTQQKVPVAGLTHEQILAKPDATKLVTADGKETTVAELRRRTNARKQLMASSGQGSLTGGSAKLAHPRGVAQAQGVVNLAKNESAAAVGMHTARKSIQASGGTEATAKARKIPYPAKAVGIETVNGKTAGFVLSPGGNVTIAGGEFGDTIGQANVMGQFPGAAAPLRVVDWRADEIFAIFPPGLRGVGDHAVTIQVITSAGKTHRLEGGKFVATREDVVITNGVLRFLRFLPSRGADRWAAPAQMHDDGRVGRYALGDSINCPPPGVDQLRIVDPGRGFDVTGLGATWGRMDSGNGAGNGEPGNRIFYPGYSFGEWAAGGRKEEDSVDVHWGVWRSHESPYITLPGYDQCLSNYTISVILSGPAGVSPF